MIFSNDIEPINEILYRALEAKFGTVKIANAGEDAEEAYETDWLRNLGGGCPEEVNGCRTFRSEPR